MTAAAFSAPARGRRGVDRTRDVAAAALGAFCDGGYRLTQIAHVAERLGVSVGTIYRYVDSKEALFHLAMLQALGAAACFGLAAPLARRIPLVGRIL